SIFILSIISLILISCVSDTKKQEIKRLIYTRYPNFESSVKSMIKQKYGNAFYENEKWEWEIKQGQRNHEFEVKYGCTRVLTTGEIIIGDLTETLTSELSQGLITYNPKSPNKGIYIRLIVNTHTKVITINRK
ncbi:MAG: hypothetical protein AAF206_11265, partial [Bacteroidota bacterium]